MAFDLDLNLKVFFQNSAFSFRMTAFPGRMANLSKVEVDVFEQFAFENSPSMARFFLGNQTASQDSPLCLLSFFFLASLLILFFRFLVQLQVSCFF